LSAIAYFIVLSKFFKERIEMEEEALMDFFPEYKEYRKRTHIYIPLVQERK
jgi:protein-S-isoprenylcysteine O-methyltransferase Ste14